jgi:Stage II sporulation protein E (SpoIIE)
LLGEGIRSQGIAVTRRELEERLIPRARASLPSPLLVTRGRARFYRVRVSARGEQARLASDALAEQAGEDKFVTGLLVRIGLSRATAGIVNAGHPPPLRLRAGQVEQIHLEADRPSGLQRGGGYRVQALELEVGDRLMFVTDGMLERDAKRMNITAILTASMNMHAREAAQHLTQAVLEASGGQLRDNATALCLDWHGGPPRDRDASSGADREVRVSRRRAEPSLQPALIQDGRFCRARWSVSGGRAGGRSRCRAAYS